MGILDDLKPLVKKPKPLDIHLVRGAMVIQWDDTQISRLPLLLLRERCPCAACVDEWTGKRTLDLAAIPADIRPLAIDPIGHYAIQIGWSDTHKTGIYSWELLRTLHTEVESVKKGLPQ